MYYAIFSFAKNKTSRFSATKDLTIFESGIDSRFDLRMVVTTGHKLDAHPICMFSDVGFGCLDSWLE